MGKIKNFINDFKAFAMKGNIIDMSVGVVIGGAFGKIVTSLVNDIITPLISLIIGKQDLTSLKWVFEKGVLNEETGVIEGEVALTYGNFLQTLLDFLIIALCIFIVLRIIMTAKMKFEALTKKPEPEPEPEPEAAPEEAEIDVLREIRDMLKKENETENKE